MIEKVIKIKNPHGLHARPAAEFSKLANKFEANITLFKDGLNANAKSVMNVMMLAAEFNSEIRIIAEGSDENQAIEAIYELNENNFNE
jgi:phosphocarrier protein